MTRLAWKLVGLLVAVLLVAPFARAQTTVSPTGGMFLNYVPGGATMTDGGAFDAFMGRIYTAPTAGGGASVAEQYGFQLGGEQLAVTSTRAIPYTAVAAAVIAAGVAGVEVGGAISHFLGNDTLTVGPVRCTASYGGWQCDGGQGAQVATHYVCESNGYDQTGPGGISPLDACQATANALTAQNPYGQTFSLQTCSANAFSIAKSTGGYQGDQCSYYGQARGTSSTCPGFTDALNPQWSSHGGAPLGYDGKCPTGRYTAQSQAQMQTLFAAPLVAPVLQPMVVPALMNDLMTKAIPITGASPRTLTGPASVTDSTPQTTTTTTPSGGGSPVTTTVYNTTNYHYDGDVITYNTTVTTNAPTGTTTTTKDPTKADPTDPCTNAPTRVGCLSLGDAGTDAPSWTTKPITYAAEDLGFAGSCPSPFSWTAFGQTHAMSYAPLCNNASAISVGMNLLAALAAAFFVIKGVQ